MKIAALDIGGTEIKYCLYDTKEPFNAGIVQRTPTNAALGGQEVVQKAIAILESLGEYERIGVCTAGQVQPHTGEILFASDNIPRYTGIKLADILEEKFKVPVIVENDAYAAGLAEAHNGSLAREGFVLVVTYGTGIGGAIIADGKLLRGSSYAAGWFGHIVTHPRGRRCSCGKRGCYEAYASTGALLKAAEKKLGKKTSGNALVHNREEPETSSIIHEWIEEVVYGLVSLVHSFNPRDIIVGGGIMENSCIVDLVKKRLMESILPMYRQVQVQKAKLGNASGLWGAVLLVQSRHPAVIEP
ncbi:MAG: ROK family protein [Treponema sp.]|nr:ROK family protein [Treponema sp.]